MQDLYAGTQVIKLTDKDFRITPKGVKLTHQQFKFCDGYVMIYAPWCPHCQHKVELWSYLGKQFNEPIERSKVKHSKVEPNYAGEKFRIAVINSEDPKASKVVSALNVSAIPRFMRASSDVKGDCDLSEYEGVDVSPEELIMGICKVSPKKKICRFNTTKL